MNPIDLDLPPGAEQLYVIAPSGAVNDRARARRATKLLSRHGFHVTLDPKALAVHQQRFAGTDDDRLSAFSRALQAEARNILAIRGGYGLTRYLPRLDFERLADSGKKWIGFSDFTAFHLAMLARADALTWAGPALVSHFDATDPAAIDPTTLETLADCLADRLELVGFRCNAGHHGVEAEGILWGGNLAIVCALLGTPFFPQIEGGILFLEDVGEHPYRIERMLTQLLHAGVLDRQSAILLGDFSWKQAEGDRYDMKQVWKWLATQTKTPVITGLPFGHEPRTLTLPHGAFVGLAVDKRTCYLVLPHGHAPDDDETGAAPLAAGMQGEPGEADTRRVASAGPSTSQPAKSGSGTTHEQHDSRGLFNAQAAQAGEKTEAEQATSSDREAPSGAGLPTRPARRHRRNSWQCWCGQTHEAGGKEGGNTPP
ncbi:MAG: LD-carboxypeptidase [Lautropia sp.]|nr:LD-carboxypeptidase [Lautropia sp.]